MTSSKMIESLTTDQLETIADDFIALYPEKPCRRQARCGREDVLAPGASLAVLRVLALAKRAAESNDDRLAEFYRGMAAGLFGLGRLAEARKLEHALAGRLEGPPASPEDPSGNPDDCRKDDEMAEAIQTPFTIDDLCAVFDADGVRYMADRDRQMLMAGFHGDCGPIHLMARTGDGKGILLLSFKLPICISEDKRSAMAEAVTRANYGMLIGGFEMDMSDGELNYKVVVPTDEAVLSPGQLRRCMGAAFSMIRRYSPAFHQVVYTDTSAEAAIDAVEQ